MGKNFVETLMGAVVLLVAATFIFISYQSGNISASGGSGSYEVKAKFREVGALATGSDVRMSGIKIGTVSGQRLDTQTYMAILKLRLNKDVKLPDDTSAAIVSDGLMGGKYISLEPGGSENYIKAGGEIKYTQDSINLESLIGRFAFGGTGDKK